MTSKKESTLPERKPMRWRERCYDLFGAYFLTICTKQKKCLLSPTNEIVPRFVSVLKRLCNKEIGENIFQRSYHDHIIRDRQDYEEYVKYIGENPMRWRFDELFVQE